MKNRLNQLRKKVSQSLTFKLGLLLIVCFVTAALLVIAIVAIFNIVSKDFVENNYLVFLIICIFAVTIVGWMLSMLLTRQYTSKISIFRNIIKRIANGDYSSKISESDFYYFFHDAIIDFNKMVDKLNSTAILQNNFASNFSHELKTPIVSIKGYAELLQNRKNLSDEEIEKYLKIIIDETDRLTHLSASTMLISNLESKKYLDNVSLVKVDEQIEECVLLLDKQLQEKNIDIDLSLTPFCIMANPDMLKEVWINLLTNAIKYNKTNGSITIKSTITEDNYVITMSDTGIGMDEKTITHVFDRYYQGDSSQMKSGAGLGLSIAKKIVNLTNGDITADGILGKGSVFTVIFPKSCSNG